MTRFQMRSKSLIRVRSLSTIWNARELPRGTNSQSTVGFEQRLTRFRMTPNTGLFLQFWLSFARNTPMLFWTIFQLHTSWKTDSPTTRSRKRSVKLGVRRCATSLCVERETPQGSETLLQKNLLGTIIDDSLYTVCRHPFHFGELSKRATSKHRPSYTRRCGLSRAIC